MVLALLGAAVIVATVAGIVIVMVTRRSHLRSWRFGFFYEAEDRYDVDGPDSEGGDSEPGPPPAR